MDEWVDQATCRTVDPEIWFPEDPGRSYQAVALCVQCPVQRECLKLSLDIKAEFGVWGGLTSSRRLKMQTSYTTRAKRDRDRMVERILNEIDEYVEEVEASREATRERDREHRREVKAERKKSA